MDCTADLKPVPQFPLGYDGDGGSRFRIRKEYTMDIVHTLGCYNCSTLSKHYHVDEKNRLLLALCDSCAAKYRAHGLTTTKLP